MREVERVLCSDSDGGGVGLLKPLTAIVLSYAAGRDYAMRNGSDLARVLRRDGTPLVPPQTDTHWLAAAPGVITVTVKATGEVRTIATHAFDPAIGVVRWGSPLPVAAAVPASDAESPVTPLSRRAVRAGDYLDAQDGLKNWALVHVTAFDAAANTVFVHYQGWDNRWYRLRRCSSLFLGRPLPRCGFRCAVCTRIR